MTTHTRRRPGARIAAPLAILALLACAGDTRVDAQENCSNIQGTEFKIFIDDIVNAAGGQPLSLMQSLTHHVTTSLEQLRVESGLNIRVINCAKRRPSALTRQNVEQLNARRVVLEVWGVAAPAVDAKGLPVHEVTVGYLLVPVKNDELLLGQPSGSFTSSRQTKTVNSIDELVRAVDQSGELAAYVAATTGVKLLRAKQYDAARSQLCRADVLLARAAGRSSSAHYPPLITYVQTLAAEVVTQAKKDVAYVGALKLLPATPGGCR